MRVGKTDNVIFVDFRPDEETTDWIIASTEIEREWADRLQAEMDAAFSEIVVPDPEDADLEFLLFRENGPQLVSKLPE